MTSLSKAMAMIRTHHPPSRKYLPKPKKKPPSSPRKRGKQDGGLIEASQAVADAGRGGDTELIHVTKNELEGLASILPMSRNPETGQPEMFWAELAQVIISTLISSGIQYAGQKKAGKGAGGIAPGDVSGQIRAVSSPADIFPEGAEVDVHLII